MDCSEFSFVLEEAREPEKMTKLIFKINRFEIKLRTVEFIHFAFGLCRNKTRIGLSRTN